jgi:non-homologous end joining protein Ku
LPLFRHACGTSCRSLYPYEIHSEAVFEGIADLKLPEQMVGLAETIIDKMTGDFEPEKFEDRHDTP